MARSRRTPRPSRQRGLNQAYPRRLADDLARQYGRMNATALRLIERLLVPAILEGDQARITAALEEIDRVLADEFSDERVRTTARRTGDRVNTNHRRLFFAGLSAAIGVRILGSDDPQVSGDIPTTPPGSTAAAGGGGRLIARANMNPTILVDRFVDENVKYISTLRRGMVEAVGDQVVRDVILGGGVTGEELVPPTRAELTDRLLTQWREKGVPSLIPTRRIKQNGEPVFVTMENHAALIARDQVSKLNGQLNRARQEAAGVREFVWETQRDSRVRPDHRALQGTRHTWAEGADGVYPGQPINCRCWARAVVSRDEVVASGGFIPINVPGPFTERHNPGITPNDPGPGAALPPPTVSSFDR
jgi:SPP1 gp7 family putative phage head morphogenesis protein